ncbi:MAG TPA: biopolymer transporter ExbD [Opitutaceae bacterium]|nr:biopolymer transporter ExbD [Opitutaceae bacterium]
MKNRKSLIPSEELTDINISPLIDMVFILLIFFIVTTVFVEEPGVEVEKPRAITSIDLQKNSVLIAITSSGQVIYGGREIGIAGVRGVVARLTQKENLPVILQADERADGGVLLKVIYEAKLANAQVYISADKL